MAGVGWDGTSGALIGTTETTPLVIANLSPVGQPIRFLAGNNGATTAMEIGAAADVWVRGPLSVGQFTGAGPLEQMRIGSIANAGGKGLVIDLIGTSTSSALHIRGIGLSGTENAGIVLQSVSNGFGTGIRIGGASGLGRPTLLTGIDITGGVGIRYNALSSGSGSAYEIGGTTPPLKGIDITTAGTNNAGLTAKANSNGVGVIGMSLSASYSAVPSTIRTGVHGYSASNSNVAADTLVGLLGTTTRGGNGGTATTSLGVYGRSTSNGSSHSGTAIGVVGTAQALAPGTAVAIGGYFTLDEGSPGFALVVNAADVFLGSSVTRRPPLLSASTISGGTLTTTQMYSADISGDIGITSNVTKNLVQGNIDDLDIEAAGIVRVNCQNTPSELSGITQSSFGRVITLIVTNGTLRLLHENVGSVAQNRIRTVHGANVDITAEGSVTLWYDNEISRWRTLHVQP